MSQAHANRYQPRPDVVLEDFLSMLQNPLADGDEQPADLVAVMLSDAEPLGEQVTRRQ